MRVGRIIGFVFDGLLLCLGLIFLLATGSEHNMHKANDAIIAAVLLALGIGLLLLLLRHRPQVTIEKTVVQRVELAGDTELETMKCQSCGATIPADRIQVAGDGSVVAACPYCGRAYQITERPKW